MNPKNQKWKHSVDLFLENTPSPRLIVVYGPTASGKTSLAIDIATHLQVQGYDPFVVSADSRQVYRYMNIGTGKITSDEMRGIPHIGLDIIEPNATFSVVDFRNAIEEHPLWKDWKNNSHRQVTIICGGTGLYIDALIYERNYMGKKPDPTLRQELENYRQEHGNQALWEKLHALDPLYAIELHPNNHTYIIRAIEVFLETGKSKKEAEQPPTLKYPTLFLTPYEDSTEARALLYKNIDQRVQSMFDSGLIEEVGYIIDLFSIDCPGLSTIGYKEVVDYLTNTCTLPESIALVAQHNRNYAKRQITWNKKYA